jgi:hypothetical protein
MARTAGQAAGHAGTAADEAGKAVVAALGASQNAAAAAETAARADRTSVGAIADATGSAAQRDAAITALNGDGNAVRRFLRTYSYPGQEHDYRVRVNQIMSAGGPRCAAGPVWRSTGPWPTGAAR